jgi:hypothetical protein
MGGDEPSREPDLPVTEIAATPTIVNIADTAQDVATRDWERAGQNGKFPDAAAPSRAYDPHSDMKRRELLKGLIATAAAPAAADDRLAHHRNLGKAFYENPTTQPQAVEEFRRALDVSRSPRGQPTLLRRAHTDGSYLAASDPRVHFGLGPKATTAAVVVRWPAGDAEIWENVPVTAS